MATSLFTRKVYHQANAEAPPLPVICLSFPNFNDGDVEANAGMALWVCPPGERYRLHYCAACHDIPSSVASVHTVMFERCQGTEAPAAGDDLLTVGINLLGADDTVLPGTLHANTADGTNDFGAGDRLVFYGVATGSPATLAGLCLTVVLVPIFQSRYTL